MIYDVLVQSLHPTLNKHNKAWVRNIEAPSLSAACRVAEARHPNLGVTPTTTSMGWALWPQPRSNHENRQSI